MHFCRQTETKRPVYRHTDDAKNVQLLLVKSFTDYNSDFTDKSKKFKQNAVNI